MHTKDKCQVLKFELEHGYYEPDNLKLFVGQDLVLVLAPKSE